MAKRNLKDIVSYKKATAKQVIKSEYWNDNFSSIRDVVNSNNTTLEDWIDEKLDVNSYTTDAEINDMVSGLVEDMNALS